VVRVRSQGLAGFCAGGCAGQRCRLLPSIPAAGFTSRPCLIAGVPASQVAVEKDHDSCQCVCPHCRDALGSIAPAPLLPIEPPATHHPSPAAKCPADTMPRQHWFSWRPMLPPATERCCQLLLCPLTDWTAARHALSHLPAWTGWALHACTHAHQLPLPQHCAGTYLAPACLPVGPACLPAERSVPRGRCGKALGTKLHLFNRCGQQPAAWIDCAAAAAGAPAVLACCPCAAAPPAAITAAMAAVHCKHPCSRHVLACRRRRSRESDDLVPHLLLLAVLNCKTARRWKDRHVHWPTRCCWAGRRGPRGECGSCIDLPVIRNLCRVPTAPACHLQEVLPHCCGSHMPYRLLEMAAGALCAMGAILSQSGGAASSLSTLIAGCDRRRHPPPPPANTPLVVHHRAPVPHQHWAGIQAAAGLYLSCKCGGFRCFTAYT
jgi:hypothetical protein